MYCIWWLLVVYSLKFSNGQGPDYKGTEFIIGFMENIEESTLPPVELFVTTMRTTVVKVHVSAPRNSVANISETFTITAGSVKHLRYDPNFRMRGTRLGTNAILVTADDEIVLYGLNKADDSTDAYLGLPTDVLGTEYFGVTYTPNIHDYTKSEIMLIGIHNSTKVSITLPDNLLYDSVVWNGMVYNKGDAFNVTLDRFDTFQFQSAGDLTGTYIRSDSPVAVFSGNKCARMSFGACDHLVEMIPPVDTWGRNFATVPIPLRSTGDKFRFVASEDTTVVDIQGGYSSRITLPKAGDMADVIIPSFAYCFINSTKAILVVQLVRGQHGSDDGDPSMLIVQPVGGYGTSFTFTTPQQIFGSFTNYFSFVIKDQYKDGLKLDGRPITATFHKIAGTDYVGGYMPILDGAHTVRHNSPLVLFAGYLYGTANSESYAFPIGMRLAPINTVCIPSATKVGDGLDNDCDGLIDEELCTVANGRKDDDGDGRVDEDCATPSPIDGGWSPWGHWSSCSQSCQPPHTYQTGAITRTRLCTNPKPQYDGKQCPGNNTEYLSCTSDATCPIYVEINGTYSCNIRHCHNITVPVPTDGITLLVNVSCGELDLEIYLKDNNSYTYQPYSTVLLSGPDVRYYYLSTGTTSVAFLTLLEILGQHNDSCTVEIAVYPDKHNGLECRKDGGVIECPKECPNPWNFLNPCQRQSHPQANNHKFAHPSDPTKYLGCDLLGNVYVVTCPQKELFSEACQGCYSANTTCLSGSRTPLGTSMVNPCSVENLLAGKFFFPYPSDDAKFIHCDVWGKAWVMQCPVREVWDQTSLTCRRMTTTKTTPPPVITPSAGNTGYTCCPTCPLHTAPCTSANIAAQRFLHPILGDRHHYIQCDIGGRMYCPMPCNPSGRGGLDFFDPMTSTCVDGSLAIDNAFG